MENNRLFLGNRPSRYGKFQYRPSSPETLDSPSSQISVPTSSSKTPFQYQPRSLENWKRAEYGSTKSGVEAANHDFHLIRFHYFISICPTFQVHVPQAMEMVKRFERDLIMNAEMLLKQHCTLAYIVGYENYASKNWKDHTRHLNFHMCFVSRPHLDSRLIVRTWRKIVGTNPKSVDVRPYHLTHPDFPGASLVEYTLKAMNDPRPDPGEFYYSDNLKYFFPTSNSHTRKEARQIQKLKERILRERENSHTAS